MNIYQSGNKVDGDLDTVRDGTDTGWNMLTGVYNQLGSPVLMTPVTTQTADAAYATVMAMCGAFSWNRDSIDTKLFDVEIPNLIGSVIDSLAELDDYGYDPNFPNLGRPGDWDIDSDGMPTFWELANGLDPFVADNNGDWNGDGYTNLDEYLAYAAIPEPTTLGLLAAGGLALIRRRR
jgi:hypothetical protein